MKLVPVMFAATLAAGAFAAQAQSIKLDGPPVKLASAATLPATAANQPATNAHALVSRITPNWTQITAFHNADGKLVARCDVVRNPALRKPSHKQNHTTGPEMH